MKLRMITTAAGPQGVWPAGAIVDVGPVVGVELVAGGFAVAIDAPSVETASIEPGKTLEMGMPVRRKGGHAVS